MMFAIATNLVSLSPNGSRRADMYNFTSYFLLNYGNCAPCLQSFRKTAAGLLRKPLSQRSVASAFLCSNLLAYNVQPKKMSSVHGKTSSPASIAIFELSLCDWDGAELQTLLFGHAISLHIPL